MLTAQVQTNPNQQFRSPSEGSLGLLHPLLFVAVFAAGEVLGMLLKRGQGPTQTQLAQIETKAKQAASMTATALQIAEPFVPALRKSTLDNQIREILRAYAQSDSRFQKELDNYHISSDDVADLIEEAQPEILGAAMFNSPSQVSKCMTELAKETAAVKAQEMVLPHQEAIDRSKARLEEILQSLRKK